MVDIAVNLTSPAFDADREAVLARAEAAGVTSLIITGSDITNSAAALDFAAHHSPCTATAGVHPHNASSWNAAMRTELHDMAAQAAPIGTIAAIGECGLDYNRNFSPPATQRLCFEEQLALAAQLGMPVFLHERDAFDDFYAILKHYCQNLPGAVVHCFTGTSAALEAYLALDCYIGITGWICDERRGSHLIPLLPHIPANRLLLETDSPYLLPRNLPRSMIRSLGGKNNRNEPCFLPHIAAFAAEVLGKTPEQLAAETTANAERLFQTIICQ